MHPAALLKQLVGTQPDLLLKVNGGRVNRVLGLHRSNALAAHGFSAPPVLGEWIHYAAFCSLRTASHEDA
jgi:hypothetical protein